MTAIEINFSRKADPRLLETGRDNYVSMIGKLFVRRAVWHGARHEQKPTTLGAGTRSLLLER